MLEPRDPISEHLSIEDQPTHILKQAKDAFMQSMFRNDVVFRVLATVAQNNSFTKDDQLFLEHYGSTGLTSKVSISLEPIVRKPEDDSVLTYGIRLSKQHEGQFSKDHELTGSFERLSVSDLFVCAREVGARDGNAPIFVYSKFIELVLDKKLEPPAYEITKGQREGIVQPAALAVITSTEDMLRYCREQAGPLFEFDNDGCLTVVS